jgi:hypothetical protein
LNRRGRNQLLSTNESWERLGNVCRRPRGSEPFEWGFAKAGAPVAAAKAESLHQPRDLG